MVAGQTGVSTLCHAHLDCKDDSTHPSKVNSGRHLLGVDWRPLCIFRWAGCSQSLKDERNGWHLSALAGSLFDIE